MDFEPDCPRCPVFQLPPLSVTDRRALEAYELLSTDLARDLGWAPDLIFDVLSLRLTEEEAQKFLRGLMEIHRFLSERRKRTELTEAAHKQKFVS